jgi:hypothetical protein
MWKRISLTLLITGTLTGITFATQAEQSHSDTMQMQHPHAPAMAMPSDSRVLVHFPEHLRIHTLSNMRDHLLTLQEIQAALASGAFDKAATVAEQRLGLSSLKLHGAHEVAPYMPEGMRATGTKMHEAASRFAIAAKDAGVTGDVRPALAALADVTKQCVACHAAYRLH